jgi:hypothetical protein
MSGFDCSNRFGSFGAKTVGYTGDRHTEENNTHACHGFKCAFVHTTKSVNIVLLLSAAFNASLTCISLQL